MTIAGGDASAPAPVPTLAFDSGDFPDGQAFALWAGSVPYDVTLPEGVTPERFRARMHAWRVDTLLVTAGFVSGTRTARTPARIRGDGRDSLSLMLMLDGAWSGDFDGLDVEVPAGRICVIDFSRPFTTTAPDTRFVVLSLPRQDVEPATAVAADRHGRVLDGLPGQLLADHFGALAHRLPETRADDLPTVAAATLAMIRSCVAHAPRRDGSRAVLSLRQRVRSYVNARLTDPDLTPDRVAEALSMTRSTLYRAFPANGVARYIQDRRLEAIHALLDDPAETRSLLDLAAAFGFASHAHFTTAFRRRFGYPPSRARNGVRSGPQDVANSVQDFQIWLSALEAFAQTARAAEATDAG